MIILNTKWDIGYMMYDHKNGTGERSLALNIGFRDRYCKTILALAKFTKMI